MMPEQTASLEETAFLSAVRTARVLMRASELLFRKHGLTSTQYNVLRILRGAGEAGATCGEIGERLINTEPDVTRLLDRMEKRGLLRRRRQAHDRRVVRTWITTEGLRVLAGLDRPVQELHRQRFAALTRAELERMIGALDKVRAGGSSRRSANATTERRIGRTAPHRPDPPAQDTLGDAPATGCDAVGIGARSSRSA